jgi:hypothetical protein
LGLLADEWHELAAHEKVETDAHGSALLCQLPLAHLMFRVSGTTAPWMAAHRRQVYDQGPSSVPASCAREGTQGKQLVIAFLVEEHVLCTLQSD